MFPLATLEKILLLFLKVNYLCVGERERISYALLVVGKQHNVDLLMMFFSIGVVVFVAF